MVMDYIEHRDPGDENDFLSEERRREVFAILGRMKPGDVAEYARRNPFYREFIGQYLQNLAKVASKCNCKNWNCSPNFLAMSDLRDYISISI